MSRILVDSCSQPGSIIPDPMSPDRFATDPMLGAVMRALVGLSIFAAVVLVPGAAHAEVPMSHGANRLLQEACRCAWR